MEQPRDSQGANRGRGEAPYLRRRPQGVCSEGPSRNRRRGRQRELSDIWPINHASPPRAWLTTAGHLNSGQSCWIEIGEKVSLGKISTQDKRIAPCAFKPSKRGSLNNLLVSQCAWFGRNENEAVLRNKADDGRRVRIDNDLA